MIRDPSRRTTRTSRDSRRSALCCSSVDMLVQPDRQRLFSVADPGADPHSNSVSPDPSSNVSSSPRHTGHPYLVFPLGKARLRREFRRPIDVRVGLHRFAGFEGYGPVVFGNGNVLGQSPTPWFDGGIFRPFVCRVEVECPPGTRHVMELDGPLFPQCHRFIRRVRGGNPEPGRMSHRSHRRSHLAVILDRNGGLVGPRDDADWRPFWGRTIVTPRQPNTPAQNKNPAEREEAATVHKSRGPLGI